MFVSYSKEDITASKIKEAIYQIVAKNVFSTRFGEELETALESKGVQTATTGYALYMNVSLNF
ncbi:DUF2922 domain-containing protein [Paraclostridium sp. AKS73]|nr:DUF2922 domain-containing protein [Paraclostridium sp. AKS73]